ncbi:hypothetical protein ACH9L7_20265 (plasmid) [Haloferax sp. S1W]|uniref:hypothetical protein n=1 Tax=Haloferax sp. S1W TaxID=3377110 RepID=UPI0037C9F53A
MSFALRDGYPVPHSVREVWTRLVEAEESLSGRERALLNLVFIDWLLVALLVLPTSHVTLPAVVAETVMYLAVGMVTTTVTLPFVAEILDE